MVIVEEVFGIVKLDLSGAKRRQVRRGFGVQGKGAAAPLPLLPRCRRVCHPLFSFGCDGFVWFFADSVFSTENIAPGSLTSDDP
jgi:hypothetical protein